MRSFASHAVAYLRCVRAASAVEFAIVFPIFIFTLFALISFGAYLAVVHGVQQIAAEAARASVPGLTDTERQALARKSIEAGAGAYPMIAPARIAIDRASTDASTQVFTVTLRYDASDMFIFNLPQFVVAPNPFIVRSAAIQRGGY